MKTIHESNIEPTKIQFKKDSLKIDYLLQARDIPEAYTMECTASPHPDLIIEREGIKARLIEILDLPEMPEEEAWQWKDRIYLTKIEWDPDKAQLKFDYAFKSPAFAQPVKCKTDWSNDFVIEDVQPFLDEVAAYITGQKRAQSDMFYQQEKERQSGGEAKQLGPAKKQIAQQSEVPAQ